MNGIRLIVGLGNPGAEYAKTRHNVGAWFVDIFAEQNNISFALQKKFHAIVGSHQKIFLLKPTTYMNESGLPVSAFIKFYKINPEEILVVHDELDFDAGIVRLKKDGGHGGHNGLRDIISHIGSDFYRLRIGIGHPGSRDDVTDYVLGNPSRHDRVEIIKSIDESFQVMPELFLGEFQKAFHTLHS
ncbi:MAG TPA: aminoacyl-tRNA hydrolase [Coxiellaceae bacterium]|nr:MAG: aminoacyl-tRNA hydrolase [Gammaproteobacteria bacterium RIFCSPHIGHO2_12_FULL_36_30]HLB55978.1 aminoacyl-tRNA hydrolase [Coxiellaceae bacterium]